MRLLRHFPLLRRPPKSGDVVLFAGNGLSSDSIKWVTTSPWSHVGLVVEMAGYDFPCLWEATRDLDVKALNCRHNRPGVRLVPLYERVARYPGQVALRRLLGVRVRPKDHAALAMLQRRLGGRAYESSLRQLARAAWDGPLGTQEECLRELFCSELAAESYQALDLLRACGRGKPSNEYTPADFAQRTEKLDWKRGRLGPEILLKL